MSNIFTGLSAVPVAGLQAARTRLNIIAGNIANAETPGYNRRDVIQVAKEVPTSFSAALDGMTDAQVMPMISKVVEDQSPSRMVYDPDHPQADPKGYVALPNINIVEEMTNMMSATRLYQACATAVDAGRTIKDAAMRILTQA